MYAFLPYLPGERFGNRDDDHIVPRDLTFIDLGIRCPNPLRGLEGVPPGRSLNHSFLYAIVTDATGGEYISFSLFLK